MSTKTQRCRKSSWIALAALVDEELAKAKASGIPAKEYFRRAVEDADGR